jgi:carboxymethylenebutenolidase
VTQAADSPHLLIQTMKAQILCCVAENDDHREPDSKKVLKDTFGKNTLAAEVDVYKAAHGWCVPDSAVYNEAERAWSRQLAPFSKALA